MKKDDANDTGDFEDFASLARSAGRGQYKMTQSPIAYSVVGGGYNVGGKNCRFRIHVDYAEKLGWKLGDLVDVGVEAETGHISICKSEELGWRLVASSKRNGITSYRLNFQWDDDFQLPNLYSQVGCDVLKEIDGGVILRIRTEDDRKPKGNVSYKEAIKVEDRGVGLTPRTRTHRFNNPNSIENIQREMDIDARLKRGESAEKRLARVREILQHPIKRRTRTESKGD